MKERLMPAPAHEKMILDESLYKLEVEKVRHEGKKREKRGVISAMRRFLQTPKGKALGIIISTDIVSLSVIGIEDELQRRRHDIYHVADEPVSPDSFAGDRSLLEVRAELTQWLGEEQVRDSLPVFESDSDRNARERRREALRRAPVANIEGFERTGVSDELITRYLKLGFPRFMTAREHVSSIMFTTEHRPMREDYHLGPGAEADGICTPGPGEKPSKIVLSGSLFNERGLFKISTAMMSVLVHELAHAIDWKNLDAVDPATRTRMLHHMVSRVRHDESRLHFPYIESISTPDEHARLLNRATEYYAEFISAVFYATHGLKDDDPLWEAKVTESLVRMYGNPDPADHDDYQAYMQGIREDVRLVRAIVEAYDPDFSWSDAALARVDIISEMYARRRMADLHEAVSRIPDPVLQTDLHARIEELAETTESPVSAFVRRAGSPDERFSEELFTMDTIEHYRETHALEQQVQQIQSELITQLESGVLPKDMPAYRALAAIYESLHRKPWTSREASDALRELIVDYAHVAPQASPAHIEAARRHEEILGPEVLPRELVQRIDDLFGELPID